MPLASALELVLNNYDIYDVDDLVAILRSPHDASQVADLIDGSRSLIDATAGTAHVNIPATPAVNVVLRVPAPPPPPITANVVLHVDVPAVPTATVGILTDRCHVRNAQAQTPRSLAAVGTTTAAQTVTTALSMVDSSTTTGGSVCTASISTDTYLDIVAGLSHSSTQTEGRVVAAFDHDQLGAQLVASVIQAQKAEQQVAVAQQQVAKVEGQAKEYELRHAHNMELLSHTRQSQKEAEAEARATAAEAQQAARALIEEKAAFDGLVTAIINRMHIEMNGARYIVWCEGEAEGAGEPRDGVYVLPSRPFVLG